MGRFGEVVTAMVTAFTTEGELDLDATVKLAEWLVDQGNDALVVAGTTGEAPVLSDDEKAELWRAIATAVPVPVIAGTGTNDTEHSVELTRMASQCGVSGILAVTPYYSRPPQSGINAHFRAIAKSTDLPVMLYDIPIRAGRKIAHDTLVELFSEVPNIVALKDAAGDVPATAALIAQLGDAVEVYSGDDALTLPLLSVGAVGVVGVATHWSAPQHQEMIAAFTKGDVAVARSVNAQLIPSFDFETSERTPNPMPTKAMMRVLGHKVGQCRLPVGVAPTDLEITAAQILADLT